MLTIWIKTISHPVGFWCVMLFFALAILLLMPQFISVIEWSYNQSGKRFDGLDGSDFPYIYVGILGIAITLAAVIVNTLSARSDQRFAESYDELKRKFLG